MGIEQVGYCRACGEPIHVFTGSDIPKGILGVKRVTDYVEIPANEEEPVERYCNRCMNAR